MYTDERGGTMKNSRTYKANTWQRFVNEMRYAHKHEVFNDIAAGIATFGLIFILVVGTALFC